MAHMLSSNGRWGFSVGQSGSAGIFLVLKNYCSKLF